jgi:N-acetylneuraminate synthase
MSRAAPSGRSMPEPVRIADRLVGPGQPVFVIAEIGINHNGDVDVARRLIEAASAAGCDAVKFQKRTIDVVYSAEELGRARESPFGDTNGDLKRGLELDEEAYRAIDARCSEHGLLWSASCWDEASVDFIGAFEPPFFKIASATLTDTDLLRHHRRYGRPIILSTGMSTLEEIDTAVEALGTDDLILLHTTSTYPSAVDELGLRTMSTLADRYGVPVGYSGHEVGLAPSVAAAALGACVVERHITLDRAMWGSDQAASVEPGGFQRLVRDIRVVERALGDGIKRVHDTELPVREKLRRVP